MFWILCKKKQIGMYHVEGQVLRCTYATSYFLKIKTLPMEQKEDTRDTRSLFRDIQTRTNNLSSGRSVQEWHRVTSVKVLDWPNVAEIAPGDGVNWILHCVGNSN